MRTEVVWLVSLLTVVSIGGMCVRSDAPAPAVHAEKRQAGPSGLPFVRVESSGLAFVRVPPSWPSDEWRAVQRTPDVAAHLTIKGVRLGMSRTEAEKLWSEGEAELERPAWGQSGLNFDKNDNVQIIRTTNADLYYDDRILVPRRPLLANLRNSIGPCSKEHVILPGLTRIRIRGSTYLHVAGRPYALIHHLADADLEDVADNERAMVTGLETIRSN